MTTTSAPRIPQTGSGAYPVAIIGRPIETGTLAHKPSSQTREVTTGLRGRRGLQETYYITACAAAEPDDADDAYLASAAWADHLGATACTEPACFPHAR